MITETVTQEMIDCMKEQELRTEYLKTVIKERGLRNLYDYLISVRLITDSWNTFQHQFTRTINSKGLLNRLYLIEPICLFLGIPVSKVFCSTDLEKTITMQDVENTSMQVLYRELAKQKEVRRKKESRIGSRWFLTAKELGAKLTNTYYLFWINTYEIAKFHLFNRVKNNFISQDPNIKDIFEFIKSSHNIGIYNWMINSGVEYDWGSPPCILDFQSSYGQINQFANLTLLLAYQLPLVNGIMRIAKKPHAFHLTDNSILYAVVNWEIGKENPREIENAILKVQDESINLNRELYNFQKEKSSIHGKVISIYIEHAKRFIQYLSNSFITPFYLSGFSSLVGIKPDYYELDIVKQQPNATFYGKEFIITNEMINHLLGFVNIWNTTALNQEISRLIEDSIYDFNYD